MDLTRLRPNSEVLSSKACRDEDFSRSGTRIISWVVEDTVGSADGGSGWTDIPFLALNYQFAFSSYSLLVPFRVNPPENLNQPIGCHSAAQNWYGQPSATRLPARKALKLLMFIDLALWPTFVRRAGIWDQNLGLKSVWQMFFARGPNG